MTTASTATLPDTSDPRYGYRHVRYNASERQRQLSQWRNDNLWNHASPESVFVAAIGNHWKPGSWQRVMDMVHFTNAYGYPCALDEIMDRCFQPYDALGAMRNEAILRACQGYDWLCMVDNDVYPESDYLVRLIEHRRSITSPYVAEPSSGRPLHGPYAHPFSGLQPVRWCVLSMLVFRVNIFNATGPELWNNAIGADEGYHFQKLWHYGFQPYLDTDLMMPVGSDPTYPLATLRMQPEDAEAFWNKRREYILSMPDRKPVNPNDTRKSEYGEYMPFANNNQQPAPTSQAFDAGSLRRAHELIGRR